MKYEQFEQMLLDMKNHIKECYGLSDDDVMNADVTFWQNGWPLSFQAVESNYKLPELRRGILKTMGELKKEGKLEISLEFE